MIRFVAITWGLGSAWAWWLFVYKSSSVQFVTGVLLAGVTLALFAFMIRRSNRLNAGYDYVTPRLEYHQGYSKERWRRNKPAREDDGGHELTLGSGW